MKSFKKFIKNNLFLSITIAMLLIVIIVIVVGYSGKNSTTDNNVTIKLSGYYYENVRTNSFDQNIYYFENDGTCFIKQKSLLAAWESSTLTVDDKYNYCTYELKNNSLTIYTYNNNYYDKLVDTKTYKIEKTDNGIKLNDVEFLNNDENINDIEENFFANYSLYCASKVAKAYGVSKYCTTWEKVSDGFYNYSCGVATIRTIIDENGISYDIYNSNSGQFLEKNYCYKIIRKSEKEISVSDSIITKTIPVKIIPSGNLNGGYVIDSIKPSVDQVSVIGYEYRLESIDFFPIYVDVDNLSSNKEFKIKLNKPIYSKSIDLDEILVNVLIEKEKTKEIVLSGDDLYKINVKNVYSGLRASLDEPLKQVKIKVNGTEKNLNEIETVKVYIDLSKYNAPGVYEVDLNLDIDESIYSYTIEPSKVKIKIT